MDRDESFQSETNYNDGQMQAGYNTAEYDEPMAVLGLTPSETRILKECQHEAIFHRGVPLGSLCLGSTYYMMKKGMMKLNRFSLVMSGITGFVFGTMSYRGVCMEKLMALPSSTLKDRILMAQGKQPHVRVEVQSPDQTWFDTQVAPMASSLDVEPYNQSHRFGDLPTKPDTESAYAVNPPLQPTVGTPYTTYDELRRKNREQYERTTNYRTPGRTNTVQRPPNDLGPSPYDPMPPPPPRRSDDFMF